jgi:hypothetical protein
MVGYKDTEGFGRGICATPIILIIPRVSFAVRPAILIGIVFALCYYLALETGPCFCSSCLHRVLGISQCSLSFVAYRLSSHSQTITIIDVEATFVCHTCNYSYRPAQILILQSRVTFQDGWTRKAKHRMT